MSITSRSRSIPIVGDEIFTQYSQGKVTLAKLVTKCPLSKKTEELLISLIRKKSDCDADVSSITTLLQRLNTESPSWLTKSTIKKIVSELLINDTDATHDRILSSKTARQFLEKVIHWQSPKTKKFHITQCFEALLTKGKKQAAIQLIMRCLSSTFATAEDKNELLGELVEKIRTFKGDPIVDNATIAYLITRIPITHKETQLFLEHLFKQKNETMALTLLRRMLRNLSETAKADLYFKASKENCKKIMELLVPETVSRIQENKLFEAYEAGTITFNELAQRCPLSDELGSGDELKACLLDMIHRSEKTSQDIVGFITLLQRLKDGRPSWLTLDSKMHIIEEIAFRSPNQLSALIDANFDIKSFLREDSIQETQPKQYKIAVPDRVLLTIPKTAMNASGLKKRAQKCTALLKEWKLGTLPDAFEAAIEIGKQLKDIPTELFTSPKLIRLRATWMELVLREFDLDNPRMYELMELLFQVDPSDQLFREMVLHLEKNILLYPDTERWKKFFLKLFENSTPQSRFFRLRKFTKSWSKALDTFTHIEGLYAQDGLKAALVASSREVAGRAPARDRTIILSFLIKLLQKHSAPKEMLETYVPQILHASGIGEIEQLLALDLSEEAAEVILLAIQNFAHDNPQEKIHTSITAVMEELKKIKEPPLPKILLLRTALFYAKNAPLTERYYGSKTTGGFPIGVSLHTQSPFLAVAAHKANGMIVRRRVLLTASAAISPVEFIRKSPKKLKPSQDIVRAFAVADGDSATLENILLQNTDWQELYTAWTETSSPDTFFTRAFSAVYKDTANKPRLLSLLSFLKKQHAENSAMQQFLTEATKFLTPNSCPKRSYCFCCLLMKTFFANEENLFLTDAAAALGCLIYQTEKAPKTILEPQPEDVFTPYMNWIIKTANQTLGKNITKFSTPFHSITLPTLSKKKSYGTSHVEDNYMVREFVQQIFTKAGDVNPLFISSMSFGNDKSDVTAQMRYVFRELTENSALRSILENTHCPQDQKLVDVIRKTVGLSDTDQVTDTHARMAIVIAAISSWRQEVFGSCQTTALTLNAKNRKLTDMMRDFSSLIQRGFIERNINGETVSFLAIPPKMNYVTTTPLKPTITGQELYSIIAAVPPLQQMVFETIKNIMVDRTLPAPPVMKNSPYILKILNDAIAAAKVTANNGPLTLRDMMAALNAMNRNAKIDLRCVEEALEPTLVRMLENSFAGFRFTTTANLGSNRRVLFNRGQIAYFLRLLTGLRSTFTKREASQFSKDKIDAFFDSFPPSIRKALLSVQIEKSKDPNQYASIDQDLLTNEAVASAISEVLSKFPSLQKLRFFMTTPYEAGNQTSSHFHSHLYEEREKNEYVEVDEARFATIINSFVGEAARSIDATKQPPQVNIGTSFTPFAPPYNKKDSLHGSFLNFETPVSYDEMAMVVEVQAQQSVTVYPLDDENRENMLQKLITFKKFLGKGAQSDRAHVVSQNNGHVFQTFFHKLPETLDPYTPEKYSASKGTSTKECIEKHIVRAIAALENIPEQQVKDFLATMRPVPADASMKAWMEAVQHHMSSKWQWKDPLSSINYLDLSEAIATDFTDTPPPVIPFADTNWPGVTNYAFFYNFFTNKWQIFTSNDVLLVSPEEKPFELFDLYVGPATIREMENNALLTTTSTHRNRWQQKTEDFSEGWKKFRSLEGRPLYADLDDLVSETANLNSFEEIQAAVTRKKQSAAALLARGSKLLGTDKFADTKKLYNYLEALESLLAVKRAYKETLDTFLGEGNPSVDPALDAIYVRSLAPVSPSMLTALLATPQAFKEIMFDLSFIPSA